MTTMGLEDIATPNTPLESVTEMWGHVLFWAFLTTTAIYLVFGVVCAVGQRAIRKGLFSLLLPVLYLGYGELKVLFTDAIASAFIAGIYATSGWTMTAGVALGWGIGLSLLSTVISMLISGVPFYAFL